MFLGTNCHPCAKETELGVQPPVGFWDPLGFTKTDDAASFRRRRYVELKHGRICMFATIGMVWPDLFGKFDGNSARGRIRLGSMGTRKVLNGKTEFMTFQISCAYFFKALPSGKLT